MNLFRWLIVESPTRHLSFRKKSYAWLEVCHKLWRKEEDFFSVFFLPISERIKDYNLINTEGRTERSLSRKGTKSSEIKIDAREISKISRLKYLQIKSDPLTRRIISYRLKGCNHSICHLFQRSKCCARSSDLNAFVDIILRSMEFQK